MNTLSDVQQQEQDRLHKLEKIRALGFDPYGTRFENSVPLAELRAIGDTLTLQPGGEADATHHRAAGRIVLLRDMGKLMFLTLRDDTGDLQVGLSKKSVCDAEWQLCKLLDLGDVIGVNGCLGRTKTGELTVWVRIPEDPLAMQEIDEQAAWDLAERKNAEPDALVESPGGETPAKSSRTHQNPAVVLLCKALIPPPAKEAAGGFSDTDLRYRQRYIDLYANPPVMATFKKRFTLIKHIRDFLTAPRSLAHPYGGFVEVETPMLQSIYGGAAARPFTTHHNTLGLDLYLRISPEIYLKRLLVGGLPRIFEINRNFRNEGISTKHNPEFTMMELYMAYGDYNDMMQITEQLISGACRTLNQEQLVVEWNGRKVDFSTPWLRLHYGDLFRKYVGCDMFHAEQVRAAALQKLPSIKDAKGHQKDDSLLVGELFETLVEPKLAEMEQPVFVTDYPAPLCPLTRRSATDPRIALRFEAYVCGMEIANAYTELNDPAIQEENFRQQLEGEGDETMRVVDTDFVNALKVGMPPAGGLGIGIDRLAMLLTNSASIRDVILFPLQRPTEK